jgi:hypothetical protein
MLMVVVVVVVVVVGYKKTFLMFHKAHFVSCAFWLEVYCSHSQNHDNFLVCSCT